MQSTSSRRSSRMMVEEYCSRKRKWDHVWDWGWGIKRQKNKLWSIAIELRVESPLPPDWQQFLDLETGKLYYYNSRTRTKTQKDPRETHKIKGCLWHNHHYHSPDLQRKNSEERNETMIAKACEHCHMLVMLKTASPRCPNCKYMHTLQQYCHHQISCSFFL